MVIFTTCRWTNPSVLDEMSFSSSKGLALELHSCVASITSTSFERLQSLHVLSKKQISPMTSNWEFLFLPGQRKGILRRGILRDFLDPCFIVNWKKGKLGLERERRGAWSSPHLDTLSSECAGLALYRWGTMRLNNKAQHAHYSILSAQSLPKAPETKVSSLEPKSFSFLVTCKISQFHCPNIASNYHRHFY